MEKDIKIDASVENSQLNDGSFTIITTPKKLDADQYSVDDLDGVTESLFGSGNMAYAILQSTQSNLAASQQESPVLDLALDKGGNKGFLPTSDVNPQDSNDGFMDGDKAQTYIEQPAGASAGSKVDNVGADGNLTNTTVNTVGGSTLASDVGHYRAGGGGGGSKSNADSSVTNNNTNNEGDTIENITNIIEGDITDILTIINNFLENAGLSLDLNLSVLDTLLGNLHLGIDDSIEGLIETGVITDNLASIVENLTGLDVSLLPNINAGITFDLLSGENIDDGNDISIAGLDTPDIDLDLVEDIIGDIDINLELPTELLDVHSVMDGVGNLADSLGNFNLASPSEIFDVLGVQDIEGLVDLDLFGNEISREFSTTIDDALGQVTDIVNEGLEFADGLVDPLLDGIVGEGLDPVLDVVGGGDFGEVLQVADNLVEPLTDTLSFDSDGEGIISQIIDPVLEGAENIIDDLTGDTVDGLTDQLTTITDDVTDALDGLTESVTGDLGGGDGGVTLSDLESAVSDLNSEIDNLIDSLNLPSSDGGDGGAITETVQNWTESTIPNADQLFDDLTSNQADADILPDPTGVVAEGIGSLDIGGSDIDVSGIGGGLFG